MKNIYGCSWWAVAAVVLNWPWLNMAAWVAFQFALGKYPTKGSIPIFPLLIWFACCPFVLFCWMKSYTKKGYSHSTSKNRLLTWLSVLLLISGPLFAFLFFGVFR